MLPPFKCCRDRDLPDSCQHFQASSSTIFPCHYRGRWEPKMHLCCGQCLQRTSSTRKPPGFLPGIPTSKLAQKLPAGTRERQLLQLHIYPGGHGVAAARATPALWAHKQNRLPQQYCCYSRELQRPRSHSRTVRLCTTSITCPSASFVFEENLHIKR